MAQAQFKIRLNKDGTRATTSNNEVVVEGEGRKEVDFLSLNKFDEISRLIVAQRNEIAMGAAIEKAVAQDPVARELIAAKKRLEAVTNTKQVSDDLKRVVIQQKVDGVDGQPEVAIEFDHAAQVITRIEKKLFDTLMWDVSAPVGSRIVIVD